MDVRRSLVEVVERLAVKSGTPARRSAVRHTM
jgi:hypothetical protein